MNVRPAIPVLKSNVRNDATWPIRQPSREFARVILYLSSVVKDPSDSQCGFAKRSSQVLAFVKNGDGSATRNQKLLKTAVCNEESDCIRQCLANQVSFRDFVLPY